MRYVRSQLLSIAASCLFATAALANPITYQFSGEISPGYGIDVQGITGSITMDPAKFTGTYGDGKTLLQGYSSWDGTYPDPGGFPGSINFTLAGGLNVDVTSTLSTAQIYVVKDQANDSVEFAVMVSGTTSNNQSIFFELSTTTSFAHAASIYTGAGNADFSFDQPVAFNGPNTWNIGYFNLSTAQGQVIYAPNFQINSVTISSAVPEPGSVPLLLLGGACVGLFVRTRRSKLAMS